ncbi:MAG: hypothetical protein S4CHLAM102_06440 [Chlamydiia bacterium]|nr:hypothetical protein [Chlamydiia bacterium]
MRWLFFLAMFSALCWFNWPRKRQRVGTQVVIAGVCKDIESALPQMIKNIEQLGCRFEDYRVVIYENNSTDHTVEILKRWAEENGRVEIVNQFYTPDELQKITQTYTWDGKPCRMELIAYARNQLLKALAKYDLPFVIMADLDFNQPWDIDGIVSSFQMREDWDVMCANGIGSDGSYYDLYALRSDEFPLGPEVIGDDYWRIAKRSVRFKGKKPIRVYSAFGGLAIYRKSILDQAHYQAFANEWMERFYTSILQTLSHPNNPHFFCYQQQHGDSLDIHFLNNSGFDQPICCEHVPLHLQLVQEKGAKIYINPQMRIQY